jgi:alpha-beta hydrolase superfamily lysophospholipase
MSPLLAAELRHLRRLSPLAGVVAVLLVLFGLGWFGAGVALEPQDLSKERRPAAQFGLSPQNVSFQSADGIALRAWYERTWVVDRPRGTVVLAHGPREDKSGMAAMAALLVQLGYSVIIPDLRCHGESGGKYTTFGYREGADVAAALEWARSHAQPPLAVIGHSSGAVAALHAAAREPQLAAVVADSSFASVTGILGRESKLLETSGMAADLPWRQRLQLWLFTHPGTGVLSRWGFRLRAGVPFDPPEANLFDAVRKIRRPAVLYLAAEGDPVVPASEVKALFAATASPHKQLVFLPGKAHGASAGDPRRYVTTLVRFLRESLAAADGR